MIFWKLYWAFFKIGLFCVGGGYASMPLIQQEIVIKAKWLTMSDLINIFAISQMTPGPIGINAATFVGTKILGVGGAIVATLGFITPSIIIMIILAKLYEKYREVPIVQGILRGVRPAVVALIASAGMLFFTLLVWKSEHLEFSLENMQYKETLLLLIALVISRKTKLGVISNLVICGILSLLMGA